MCTFVCIREVQCVSIIGATARAIDVEPYLYLIVTQQRGRRAYLHNGTCRRDSSTLTGGVYCMAAGTYRAGGRCGIACQTIRASGGKKRGGIPVAAAA